MAMNNENIEENLKIALPYAEHFHISEPFLELITNDKTNHEEFAKTLKSLNYDKLVSIEMKNGVMDSKMNLML
jgi:pyruvate-formate lyase-activating enzyme